MTEERLTGRIRIIGIDPGLADTGWGVIECDVAGHGIALVEYGVIRTEAGRPLPERLSEIFRRMRAIIARHEPQVAAVEELFFSKNVKTAMVVAHGRAASLLATAEDELILAEYTPNQIKQALTGSGRAAKMQVQLMVRATLGLEEIPSPNHAADALAAAVCYAHSIGTREKLMRTEQALNASLNEEEADPRKLLLAQRRGRRRRR